MEGIECAGFKFYNNFDSANLAKVVCIPPNESVISLTSSLGKTTPEIPDAEFNIWTKPDCCGTEFENANRTWFYFGVQSHSPGLLVRLNIIDLNKQGKMYSQGMAPVFRVVPGKAQWERIRDKPVYTTEENIFTLSFKFRAPENVQTVTYFAFTYPFSYLDLQRMFATTDARFVNAAYHSEDDIYYRRELVCRSLENREVTLITISSHHGITSEQETRLKNLFPEPAPRPFKFTGKKVIFVSARVHPGETPSTFVFNGLLNLLLTREDPIAMALRKHYVFKMIPFLNPDGVAQGHYRTDTRGVNLNRVYLNPLLSLHPPIFAARALLRYYHYGEEREDCCEECNECTQQKGDEKNSLISSDGSISTKVSNMSLEEGRNAANNGLWCFKCKGGDGTDSAPRPGSAIYISTPTTDHHDNKSTLYPSGGFCEKCKKSGAEELTERLTITATATPNNDESRGGDFNNRFVSDLFLYIDLHGHASKKGIFMYGNHFEDLERNVECMLLPKLMSLNNHNFHFTACNFSERNMYLRDRRDGMSREGSGRVAVLKLTGLTRSYTLECNYNTGRIVNVLPPTVKEPHSKMHIAVPPKYNPHVFEEVGKSLGASILDLTGQNPCSRLSHSEFHTLSGLREWLRTTCAKEMDETRSSISKIRLRRSASAGLHPQGKFVHGPAKSRVSVKTVLIKKKLIKPRPATVPIDKKENMAATFQSTTSLPSSQPGCSHSEHDQRTIKPSSRIINKAMGMRSKTKKDFVRKCKASPEKQKLMVRSKSASQKLQKTRVVVDKNDAERVKFREICFVKPATGDSSKYNKSANAPEEGAAVAATSPWKAPAPKANPKTTPSSFVQSNKNIAEPGTSKQGQFAAHTFEKGPNSTKGKFKKHTLRRLANAADCPEKVKKRKKLKSK